MNITQEEVGENIAIIQISITEEDYTEKVNSKLKDYKKKAQMPGFRPGMVPMGLIKKMYGQSVIADEVNTIISDALNKHIIDNKIEILGNPLPNMEKTKTFDFDNQKEFDFYFDIAIAPEINVEMDENFTVPYYKISVSEDDIDNTIKNILDKHSTSEELETVKDDSHIKATIYEIDEEEKKIDKGETLEIDFDINEIKTKKNQKLFIGKQKGAIVNEIPHQLFGTKEKAAHILHIKDKKSNLLDKMFAFEITGITKKRFPEINEELYEKIYPGAGIKTEEAFRKQVKEDIFLHYQKETDKQLLNDVTEKLIKEANINLPEDFLKRWLFESNEGKITKEQIDQQYESYSKTMQWQLIEAKLRSKFPDKLNLQEEEIKDEVRRYFNQGIIPEEKDPSIEQIVNQVLSNEKEKENIAQMLMEKKYTAFFKDKVKKDEKEVTMDEFIKIISKQ